MTPAAQAPGRRPAPGRSRRSRAAGIYQAQQQLQAAAGRGAAAFGRGGGGRGATTGCQNCDIAPTYASLDATVAPQFTADETFFDFLLSGAPTKFADLKAKADRGEALTGFAVPNTKVTVTIDNTYEIVSEQLSHNVVGMVEGTDPKLKDTYVMFGAHLDHIG